MMSKAHNYKQIADAERRVARNRLASLARLLDSSIALPGGVRIGLDGIVGLVPGVGDLAGVIASSYFVLLASRAGVSRSVQMLMVYNILFEMLVGSIPLIGDVFDFFWKANERNLALFDEYMDRPAAVRHKNRAKAAFPLVLLLLAIVGAGLIAVAVVKACLGVIQNVA
jgi:hypothetical protein